MAIGQQVELTTFAHIVAVILQMRIEGTYGDRYCMRIPGVSRRDVTDDAAGPHAAAVG